MRSTTLKGPIGTIHQKAGLKPRPSRTALIPEFVFLVSRIVLSVVVYYSRLL